MKSEICILNSCENIERLLLKEFFFSRSQIKKSDLSKKKLKKKIKAQEKIELPANLLNNGLINPSYTGSEIEVIFEDKDLFVVNKPIGVHGHPLKYTETKTVLNFLRNKLSSDFLGKFNSNKERGLLYRLDEVTSGVLIFVKSEKLHTSLRGNFENAQKLKSYMAVVKGDIKENGELVHWFSSKGERGNQRVLSEVSGEEKGELSFEKVFYNAEKDHSLVRVTLKTGLRHQIRAQLSHIGHPILGDELYGGDFFERVCLHAHQYTVEIEGQVRSFGAPVPELFLDFLDFNSQL